MRECRQCQTRTTPPATPSQVFPGLIVGASLCLPIALPDVISASVGAHQHQKEKRQQVRGELLLEAGANRHQMTAQ